MRHTRLFPYQAEGVRAIHRFEGRALLCDDMGLGKTLQSLYYAWKFVPDDPPGPVVVVCPAHLKLHWKREAEKHLGLRAEVLYGDRCPPDKLPPLDANQVFVVNYDILTPPEWMPRTRPAEDSWVQFLTNLNPRLIICDEAHLVKCSTTARTRAVRWMARRVPHVLLLTGTPLANTPPDLWSLLNILHPKAFPSQLEFNLRYTHARKNWYGWEFKGAKNLKELNEVLLRWGMIRRRKADVLSQLPPVTYTVVPLEVDLAEYRRAENDYLGWLEEKSPVMARRAAAAEELSRLNGLWTLAGELKVGPAAAWCRGVLEETRGKLLLGAIHYAVTEPLVDALRDAGSVLVDGRTPSQDRQVVFDRFNADPACRVLVGNIDAAGTGWSCRSTSDVALCELPWRPADLSQFVARVHGLDRGLPGSNAHARLLIAHDTIETDLAEVLQRKAEWASAAVDGIDGDDGLNIREQVKAHMKQRRK